MSTAFARWSTDDAVWKEGRGRYWNSLSGLQLESMERSWKDQIELTIATVMGTSFKVRMSPQETVLDIKRRIYFREGKCNICVATGALALLPQPALDSILRFAQIR